MRFLRGQIYEKPLKSLVFRRFLGFIYVAKTTNTKPLSDEPAIARHVKQGFKSIIHRPEGDGDYFFFLAVVFFAGAFFATFFLAAIVTSLTRVELPTCCG